MTEKTEPKTVEMTISEKGTFELDSIDRQMAYANSLISKGLVSETFKNPSQLLNAIQTCKALGVEPVVGLKWAYVIAGKAAFFGDFPLMTTQRHSSFEGIEEFFIDDKCERICALNKNIKDPVFGAVCRLKRKGDPIWSESYFTRDDATKAGLYKNQTWNKYERDMLMYRARGRGLRGKFADALGGMEIAEFFVGVDTKETEQDRAEELTQKYRDAVLVEPKPKD